MAVLSCHKRPALVSLPLLSAQLPHYPPIRANESLDGIISRFVFLVLENFSLIVAPQRYSFFFSFTPFTQFSVTPSPACAHTFRPLLLAYTPCLPFRLTLAFWRATLTVPFFQELRPNTPRLFPGQASTIPLTPEHPAVVAIKRALSALT